MLATLRNALRSLVPPPRTDADVAAAERDAVAEAMALWESDIYDPRRDDHSPDADRCRAVIDRMIRSSDGSGWSWLDEYSGDGQHSWCGNTVAWCYRRHLPLATRRAYLPSTYRLDRWASYRQLDERTLNPRPTRGPWRTCVRLDERSTGLPAGFVPQPGDILLSGGVPSSARRVYDYGQHVEMVTSFDAASGTFAVIGGNAGGLGPRHERQQGVTVSTRPIGLRQGQAPTTYHVRRVIRIAPEDLVRQTGAYAARHETTSPASTTI